MAIAERIAGGEDPESARLAAIKEFGNVLQAKEDARQVWRGGAVAMLVDVCRTCASASACCSRTPDSRWS